MKTYQYTLHAIDPRLPDNVAKMQDSINRAGKIGFNVIDVSLTDTGLLITMERETLKPEVNDEDARS